MASNATATPAVNPEEMSWEITHEETPDRIVFDEEGDWIVGIFVGHEWITPPPVTNKAGELEDQEPFLQLIFRDVLTSSGDRFRLAVTNAGYQLRMAFEKGAYTNGYWSRTTLVKSVEVDQAAPMKDIRVEKGPDSAGNHK